MIMAPEPNGSKLAIKLTISPDDKKWLREHSWVNASGLLENAIQKLRDGLKDNEFFAPLR